MKPLYDTKPETLIRACALRRSRIYSPTGFKSSTSASRRSNIPVNTHIVIMTILLVIVADDDFCGFPDPVAWRICCRSRSSILFRFSVCTCILNRPFPRPETPRQPQYRRRGRHGNRSMPTFASVSASACVFRGSCTFILIHLQHFFNAIVTLPSLPTIIIVAVIVFVIIVVVRSTTNRTTTPSRKSKQQRPPQRRQTGTDDAQIRLDDGPHGRGNRVPCYVFVRGCDVEGCYS